MVIEGFDALDGGEALTGAVMTIDFSINEESLDTEENRLITDVDFTGGALILTDGRVVPVTFGDDE